MSEQKPRRVWHYLDKCKVVVTLAVITASMAKPTYYGAAAIAVWTVMMIVSTRKHEKTLCAKCFDNSLSNIDNAPVRYRRSLRYAHWYAETMMRSLRSVHMKKPLVVESIAAFGPVVIAAIGSMFSVMLVPYPYGAIVISALILITYLQYRPVNIHGQYQSVCPWCRDGGGGDWKTLDTPTPTPHATINA